MAVQGPHWELAVGESPDKQHVFAYIGDNQPEFEIFDFLPKDNIYSAQVIDTWNMTSTKLNERIDKNHYFHIPRKPYQAILLTKIN